MSIVFYIFQWQLPNRLFTFQVSLGIIAESGTVRKTSSVSAGPRRLEGSP